MVTKTFEFVLAQSNVSGATSAITVVLVIATLGLFMYAAQRGKPTVDPRTGALLFRHSIIFRGFSIFTLFGIPAALSVLLLFKPPEDSGDVKAVFGIFALFIGLGLPLFWESTRYGLFIGPEGLDCRSPWRGQKFIAWKDVKNVSFSPANYWFIIQGANGVKFRVPCYVSGVTQFLEKCEQNLPPAMLAKAEAGYKAVKRVFPGAN